MQAIASRSPRVLVVDDDRNLRTIVAQLLELDGYECDLAASGDEALHSALERPPDLIVLDLGMPGLSGTEVLKTLRDDYRTRHVPVMMLTARDTVEDRVREFEAGADDYLAKPFHATELIARARNALLRSELLRGLNPITLLPGNAEIANEIDRRLAARRPFACLYIDIDLFKSYNDHYGFTRGDAVIRLLGESIVAAVDAVGADNAFVGHVGGDDFIVLAPIPTAEPIAAGIVERFDREVPRLYEAADRGRGWIEAEDRAGKMRRTPFISVSIGILPVPPRRFGTAVELARSASDVKEAAKRTHGSAWIVDRRRPS